MSCYFYKNVSEQSSYRMPPDDSFWTQSDNINFVNKNMWACKKKMIK